MRRRCGGRRTSPRTTCTPWPPGGARRPAPGSRRSERLRPSAPLYSTIPGRIARSALGVGPIRLLGAVAQVVGGGAVGELDELRHVDLPRFDGAATLEVERELLGERAQDAGDEDLLLGGQVAA